MQSKQKAQSSELLKMASMATPTIAYCAYYYNARNKRHIGLSHPRILLSYRQNEDNGNKPRDQIARREIILRSSELAVVGAIFNLSGKKPGYLGAQKNQQTLALCAATKHCISTSENISDPTHYAPPGNYNGSRKKPVSREVALEELLQVRIIIWRRKDGLRQAASEEGKKKRLLKEPTAYWAI